MIDGTICHGQRCRPRSAVSWCEGEVYVATGSHRHIAAAFVSLGEGIWISSGDADTSDIECFFTYVRHHYRLKCALGANHLGRKCHKCLREQDCRAVRLQRNECCSVRIPGSECGKSQVLGAIIVEITCR